MATQKADYQHIETCYHCGENCNETIEFEEKAFCCEGCKLVYGILKEKDLCAYYNLNDHPGINLKAQNKSEFKYLDETDIQEKLIDFKEGEITKVHFYLPKIHCSSCIWLLENLYQLREGILSSKVHFTKKEISLSFQHEVISLREVAELLSSIGYSPEIRLDALDGSKKKGKDKRILYQLGLAGFAFGNIMLFSFPEYLGMEKIDNESFTTFFGYLNIVLIIPVILYSAKDYWLSAKNSLLKGRLNIDVPITLGIIVLFGRSAFEILSQTGVGYMDSLAGLVFFLLIGKWFQKNTYERLSFDRDYKSFFPINATIKEGHQEIATNIQHLQVGQRIIIRNGELIPTDSILLKGNANIDYSFVTGESKTIKKRMGEKLYAGGRQKGGIIELEVIRKINQSYLTQLWNEDVFQQKENTSQSQITDQIAKHFTWVIIAIATITFLYWYQYDAGKAFNATTAVLIIACPCALALAAPFIYGNVLRILAKRKMYVKNTQTIEKIKDLDHIVFDKTGTITSTDSKLQSVNGHHLNPQEEQWVKSITRQSAHPVSKAFYQNYADLETLQVDAFEENVGLGVKGKIGDHLLRIGSEKFILQAQGKGTFIEIDGQIKGHFIQDNNFRENIRNVINNLQNQYQLSLLTGDNSHAQIELEQIFELNTPILFHQSPKDKINYIKTLQQQSNKIMMIGDGLNDAGALRQSDVGLVITEDTNNFTPASDIILHASQLQRLPTFLAYMNNTTRLLYVAYIISLIYNIAGLYFAVQAELSPIIAAILMPLSSITTLLFGIISTNLLARKMKL